MSKENQTFEPQQGHAPLAGVMSCFSSKFKNMEKIVIQSCKECPHFKSTNQWSSDSLYTTQDWMCSKADKDIQERVEWHEESKIKIPNWCPDQNGI